MLILIPVPVLMGMRGTFARILVSIIIILLPNNY